MDFIMWIQSQIATNQFFSAAIGGSLFYTFLNYGKVAFFSIYNSITNYFTRNITVSSYRNNEFYQKVLLYFSKFINHPKNIEIKPNNILGDTELLSSVKEKQLVKSISYGTHWFFYNWYTLIKINISTEQHHGDKSDIVSVEIISMFPRYIRDLVLSQFNCKYVEESSKSKIFEYSSMYGGFTETSINHRGEDSVFVKSEIKEKIESAINALDEKQEIYERAGINRKLGILLYGPPGTGKSSLILALAKKFKRSVYYLDPSTKNLRDKFGFKDIPPYSFVVIEDMDCYTSFRVRTDNIGDVEKQEDMPKILKMLDGASLADNITFFATTNYLDKIDPAVKRFGRFDVQVELDLADKELAEQMVNYIDPSKLNLLDSLTFPLSQAEIQAKILKEKK